MPERRWTRLAANGKRKAEMQTPILTLNDGASIPQFGMGVWQIPDDQVTGLALAAFDAGYRHIDTARIYGNEGGVGRALRETDVGRDEIFITTKLWNTDQGFDPALRAFDESMELLGLDVLDLYLIHWPVPFRGRYVDSWKAMVRLREEGRVRSIGVSNFNASHIEKLIAETGVVPAVNQVELHPRFQQRALRAFHAEHGIATESWSPSGSGRMLDHPVLGEIARKHGKSVAQVIFRWHVQEGLVVIPKSANPGRIRENIAIFDFVLDEGDMAKIKGLDDPEGRNGSDPETNEG